MNYTELIPLTAALLNCALTVFVASQGVRSTTSRVYILWGVSLSIWNFGTFMMFRTTSESSALFWARFLQFGVIFLPISLAHLCALMGQIKINRFFYAAYAVHIALAISNFTDFFIPKVRHIGYAYYGVAGPGFWILVLTYSIPALMFWQLNRKRKLLPPLRRRRLTNMIWTIGALIVFGVNDSLPVLGLEYYPFLHGRIYPLGSAAAVFYGIIVSYSVLQHKLFDINISLSQAAARLVRFSFLFLIGLSLLLILNVFKANEFTAYSFFGSLAVLLISAVVASVFFPRLFGGGDEALERRILGDRFEYQDRVQDFIKTMPFLPDTQSLLDDLRGLLTSTMRVRTYQIILLDDATRGFMLFHSLPSQPQVQLPDLQTDSPVLRYFQKTHASFLSCNLAYDAIYETVLAKEARQQLKRFEPEFCFPFFSSNELVGLMLLGSKVDQDLFTPHDLRLLSELSSNLGPLLNQIRLRQQLQSAHEQDLLGRMSRGLAHDLNNLLTPVQTLLQLFHEAQINQETIDELLPMSLNNLKTVRAYVSEALFFSRTSSLKGSPESLVSTVREALEIVQSASKKSVEIIFPPREETIIEMDAVLIKRLVCNLLSNAIDASEPGSTIEVSIAPLPKTELSRDWYRLQISDHGEGISPENLKRVSAPYFTTKDTGDGNRGFGLGLAIARKIVNLHGGNLSIASKEKIGTTVQVDLPGKLSASQIGQQLAAQKPEPVIA